MSDDKWYVRSKGGRLLRYTEAESEDEALEKFLCGKRNPTWGRWFESGYRLVKIVITYSR